MKDLATLMQLATSAHAQAYAPYSQFQVGACIESANGQLFSGCNVENASYGLTICAEGGAISAMIASGERHIKQMVVLIKGPSIASPCGACRQRIAEFANPETIIHLCNLQGDHQQYTINELLPHAFNKSNLNDSSAT